MAPSVVDDSPSNVFLFNDGDSGKTLTFPGGAPSVGEWDVLCANSDTVVGTPTDSGGAAFVVLETRVSDQASYIFGRQATGGETDSVVVNTVGNFNTSVIWRRVAGGDLADISSSAIASTAGTATPALTTDALAEADELVLVFAALHNFPAGVPSTFVWGGSYAGNELNGANQGTGASGVIGSTSFKAPAGPGTEAPSCTWTNSATDRYILAASFTAAGAPAVEGTLAASAPAATVSLSGDVTAQGTLAASAPAATVSLSGDVTAQGVLTASAPAASVALTGDQPVQGMLTVSAPAGVASLAGTNATVTLGRLLAMQTTTVTIYEPSSIDEWSGERTADTLVASDVPASVIEQGRTVNDPKTRTARVVRQATGRVPDGAPVTTDSRIVDGEGRTYAVRSVRQPRNPVWIGDVILELLRTDQQAT